MNPTYLESLNDSTHMRYSRQRFRTHTVETSMRYAHALRDSGGQLFVCRHRDWDVPVATVSAAASREHDRVDLGLLVFKAYSGGGLGKEAWLAALRWLLTDVQVRKITAGTTASNAAMRSIIEGSGMILECCRPRHELLDGVPQDVMLYATFSERGPRTNFIAQPSKLSAD